jgi:thioesterase domain-containing protein
MKYRTVEDIADYYLNELLIAKPHGPYIIGGFSFGGLVAYEMAQKLIAKGEKVELLVIIDTFYPQAIGSLDSTKKKWSLYILCRKLFYGLPLKIFNFIIKKPVCLIYLHYKKPIPVNLRSYYIIDIYYKISPKYFPKSIDCSMLFFCAEHSEFVNADRLWKEKVKGNMYVHKVPGDHLSMISDPENFKALAEILKNYLNKEEK